MFLQIAYLRDVLLHGFGELSFFYNISPPVCTSYTGFAFVRVRVEGLPSAEQLPSGFLIQLRFALKITAAARLLSRVRPTLGQISETAHTRLTGFKLHASTGKGIY